MRNIFIFLSCISFFSCAQTTYKHINDNAYNEDLSPYRTEYALKEKSETSKPKSLNDDTTPVNRAPYLVVQEELDRKMSIQRNKYLDKGTYKGFAIQVYNGVNRVEAEKAKSIVYRVTDKYKPKVIWDPPYYKVQVGEFDERLLAYPLFNRLRDVSSRVIIVPQVFTFN